MNRVQVYISALKHITLPSTSPKRLQLVIYDARLSYLEGQLPV